MDNVFHKGFLPTKDKKCTRQYKNKSADELMTYEEVKNLPEFAGILAEDTVLIDVDDMEQSEILMKLVEEKELLCRVYSSRKGMHFLFKNNGSFKKCRTKTKICVGLCVDIKVGCSNSYEVLKIDGKERELLYDILEGESYQAAPTFLNEVKSKIDFVGMEEGSGRDSALYGYILSLQSAGLDKDEAIECIKIINEYLLKDKMSDDDIERITRDEAFLKPVFYVNNTFQHDTFAQFMRSEHHIKRINGQLHIYRNGIYVPGYRYIENLMTQTIPTIKANQRTEVLKYLEVLIPDNESTNVCENMIAFRNGVYDRKQKKLFPFSPDYIITNVIPWDYNQNAYDELTDKTLDKLSCNDVEIRSLLEECIGYTFYRKNNLQKSFILTGSGSNGKSTFLEMVKNLLGEQNVSQLDIGELDDRFSTVMMYGKLANIGDDVSSDFLDGKTLSVFKKAVTGNGIKGEQKGQDGFFFKPYTKLIFSANSIPRMKSRGFDAVKRRILIIPFNAKFSRKDEDYDYEIEDKLKTQSAMEYIIRLGLEGLDRVLTNKGFTESKKVQKEIDEFERENNPLLGWLDTLDEHYLYMEDAITIYRDYEGYCVQNNHKPLANNVFSSQLMKEKGLESYRRTINKRKITMYRKIESGH